MSTLNELNLALKMKRKYGLDTFVETGCENGYGLEYAKAIGFKTLYSCDIDDSKTAIAFNIVHPDGLVYHGDSESFLTYMLDTLADKRCLFWLDAHFPSEFGMPGAAPEWPIKRELEILANKKGIENDVILCDDMHCIKSPDNPLFNPAVLEERQQQGTIKELTEILPLAHRLLGLGNGILLLEPR